MLIARHNGICFLFSTFSTLGKRGMHVREYDSGWSEQQITIHINIRDCFPN